MALSPHFPVRYEYATTFAFASKAAAESNSELSKCEVVYYCPANRKIAFNKPARLLFKYPQHALYFIAKNPLLPEFIDVGIVLIFIFYENDPDVEIKNTPVCVSDLKLILR
jgi:hypothetical protein